MPSRLFGGRGRSVQQTPTSFRSPGFNATLENGTFNFRRRGTIPQLEFDKRFGRSLEDIDALRGTVRPGFSEIRESRRAAIEGARSRGIGSLRESIGRRRLEGSSFGEASLIRAEREFGQAQADASAQSFLEELETNRALINQEQSLIGEALNRELAEFGLALDAGRITSANAQFQAQQAAQDAQGRGRFFGSLINAAATGIGFAVGGPVGAAVGSTAASGFTGGGGPSFNFGGTGGGIFSRRSSAFDNAGAASFFQ